MTNNAGMSSWTAFALACEYRITLRSAVRDIKDSDEWYEARAPLQGVRHLAWPLSPASSRLLALLDPRSEGYDTEGLLTSEHGWDGRDCRARYHRIEVTAYFEAIGGIG